MSIGIRQLRRTLSEQLAAVQDGHTVTITSHGKPIARLVPVGRPTKLEQLRAAGLVREPTRQRQPLPEPARAEGTVSDLVAEQRR
ncbi:type II toxin-antitoxin system Phd/YefM family antitoxin [Aeromicrobium fastidiosum]|uniref:Antitoxin n=1 Tax=Aeromicrobium fastidiosum TaxID=52699 RepID=A0A641ARC5_9ACTN|nr:type II toxin-antitoxin system prevent-host-death family antitoxin [Aeromicrobium fastidiosum]KAA1380489.1 type II toxin-antitoxin system prevent-host-death family antitoxin [Aeromicrobium fastidiosum]MBP2390078.1 prevent-host-death family protein [Aeromicrobium fastidiosum]